MIYGVLDLFVVHDTPNIFLHYYFTLQVLKISINPPETLDLKLKGYEILTFGSDFEKMT